MKIPDLIEKENIFIFDGIQECPRALLSLKTNIDDYRYDYIANGSYLGLDGYVINDQTPKPVGCVEEFDMRTFDFEEFLCAKGLKEEQISFIKDAFNERKPLSNSMHKPFSGLFRQYLCVGGFPEAVKNYILTNNIYTTLQITRRISNDLKNDFGRRRGKDNKPIFQVYEVARIGSAYSLIPSFLGKENKRYIVSKITDKGAKDGNAKSAKTVLKNEDHYGKTKLICIKNTNLSYTNDILTIPHYMTFLLFDWSPIVNN